MELIEAIKQRHSVRKYIDKHIEKEKVESLNEAICNYNALSGLNIQLVLEEPKAFSTGMWKYGQFSGVMNYLVRCRRLVQLGQMTPAGLAVAPDLDPSLFIYEDWLIKAIKADKQAWMHWQSFPENYRRIKADRIQHYHRTGRQEYAEKNLNKLIQDCHDGKLQSGWSDFGRLT